MEPELIFRAVRWYLRYSHPFLDVQELLNECGLEADTRQSALDPGEGRMKIVRNTGTDRVVDLLRPRLTAGRQLDVVTPSFSLFAFAEIQHELAIVTRCRLLLPPANTDLAVLGSDADRTARNRLQTRWLASALSRGIESKAEVRRALGAVPQGAFVVRDAEASPCRCFSARLGSTLTASGSRPAIH